MTAEDYYKLGNEHRRKGDWKHALDCYLENSDNDLSVEKIITEYKK